MKTRITLDKEKGLLFNKSCNSCEGLYPNSMDVRFSKSCDNACLFCIEQEGIESAKFNIEKMIESTRTSGKKEILILGGEPFLFVDKLLTYIEGIRPFVDKIYITTALPSTLSVSNKKVIKIVELIDGINCSVHHYTDKINSHILNTRTTHSRLDILDGLLKLFPDKVRVMGNLCKDGLDSEISVLAYLKYMTERGAKEIKLNELQFAPDMYVNFEKIMAAKLPSPYAFGCQRYVEVDGYRCLLKRACFFVEDSLDATFNDLCKTLVVRASKEKPKKGFIVLYEDGNIYNG